MTEDRNRPSDPTDEHRADDPTLEGSPSGDPTLDGDDLPTVADATASSAAPALGSTLGDYRILRTLGEGGMGVVYEAEQQHPRRKVALKVVRGGRFVDQNQVKMFQREAETLARLRHPNIAAIYESGRTDDGQHFFAMELVRGETLHAYLKKRSAVPTQDDLELRLGLFRKITDAVHYAHQRGVIHRDLKPSNIFVTDEYVSEESVVTSGARVPEIKILDFGLARITEGDVTATTMTTEVGIIKGTLPYMSPEQTRGDPAGIDLRSDVYALGVILHQMLVGSLPYDVRKTSLVDAIRVICETPPTPLRQSSFAARSLDPDIETIVGKALEKDADRRYSSAAGLSDDVGRYLTSQPILARPPSTVYQFRKFAQRNRTLVGGVVATAVVLLVGAVTSTVLALREGAQRREAERARTDLEAVVDFQAGMLSGVDPEEMGRRLMADLRRRAEEASRRRGGSDEAAEASVGRFEQSMQGVNATDAALRVIDEDVLKRAAETIHLQFAEQPMIEARLRDTIGVTYRLLGLYDEAEEQAAGAVEILRGAAGDEHADTLRAVSNLAAVHHDRGHYDEAERLYRETLVNLRHAYGDAHPSTLRAMNNLATVYQKQTRYEDAEEMLLEALEQKRATLGSDDPGMLPTMINLANVYRSQGKLGEAEEILKDAVELSRRTFGDEHARTLSSINNLANAYESLDRLEDAERLHRETLETRRRVLGDEHPDTLLSMHNVAVLCQRQRRADEAEALYLEMLDIGRRVLSERHPRVLSAMSNLADVYLAQGRLDEAEALLVDTLDISRRELGEEVSQTLSFKNRLANVYVGQGRAERALAMRSEVLAVLSRVLGDEHPDTIVSMKGVAFLLQSLGRYGEAADLRLRLLETYRRTAGDEARQTLAAMNDLAHVYERQGRYEDAEASYRTALAVGRRAPGEEDPLTLILMNNLGGVCTKLGKSDEAHELLREAFDTRVRVLGKDHAHVAYSHYNLACLAAVRGDREVALEHLRSALRLGWAQRDVFDDDALDSLRGDPEFETLVEPLRARLGG